ncbi:MAG: glycosyltransferase family 4 protein [Planctomycetota bacterium]
MMNVLLVNTYYYMRGGDCRSTFNIADMLRSRQHKVINFAMHHPINFPCEYSDYFSYYIDFPEEMAKRTLKAMINVLSTTFYNRGAAQKIRSLVRDMNPQIAHLNNYMHHLGISIVYALRNMRVPIVWTLRDYTAICPNTHLMCGSEICESCHKTKYFMAPLKKCKKGSFSASFVAAMEGYFNRYCGGLRYIDLFIAPSEFLRNKAIEYGIPKRKIIHIPNFIKVSDYQPVYSKGCHFLYMGRLDEHKGVKTLLDAMKKLKDNRLLIAGDGPQKSELEEYAKDNSINNVEFLGHLRGERLKKTIADSIAVVVPSMWYEVFGLVIVEAYASGKPAITASIGGMTELVRDGVTGFLFEPGNADQLADKMNYLANHREEAQEMGKKGRGIAEQHYTPEVHYESLMKAYKFAVS